MDVIAWQERLRHFAVERDWEQFHTPKNLAMAMTVEAAELLEIFQWLTPSEATAIMGTGSAQRVREEVADVLIYLLRLTDVLNIDIEEVMRQKVEANAVRYDPHTVRGSATKQP